MANNKITYVDQLDAKQDFVNMKVRIIRRWKQVYRLDMVLIDEKGRKIQATVKKELIPRFDDQIKEDTVVLIKKFGVAKADDPYPVVKNELKLNFYKCTEVCTDVCFNGHPYGFAFVPFNEITLAKARDPSVLNVDVIGCVTWCGNLDMFKSSKGKESKRFNFEMKDFEGRLLRCTLWGDYAVQFKYFVDNNNSGEHVITIIQHGLIKEWNDTITVQSDMFGTRVFINEDIQESHDLRRRLILNEGNAATSSALSSQQVYPNRLEFLLNTERKHVDEVRECETAMECVVLGTIALLEEEFGWFYVGCRKCNKKVINKQEFLEGADIEDLNDEIINAPIYTLFCPKEKAIATQLIPKFRLTFRVQDTTGSASFLMFDRDVSRILGLSASDIRERQLKSGETESFPHELNALLNKQFAFKISISKYNLDRKYSIYTVIKLCSDPDIIDELLNQDNDNEVIQGSHETEFSTVRLNEPSQGAMSSKASTSVTGDSFGVDMEKDTETSPLQKKCKHTPGVESTNVGSKKMRKISMTEDV